MKALIVDDERLARQELQLLLRPFSFVQVVGEAANAEEALALVKEAKPSLLFLDVEMPGQSGFDLIQLLPEPLPEIIFTTAYEHFALRAFAANAIDYLLKPIEQARLEVALKKARGRDLDPSRDFPLTEDDHVFVREGDKCWFIAVRSIALLEAEGNHTRVHLEDGSPLIYRTLGSMEERLPGKSFLRANRSLIINLKQIEAINPWFGGSFKVRLKGGREVEFSRRQAQVFRERLTL